MIGTLTGCPGTGPRCWNHLALGCWSEGREQCRRKDTARCRIPTVLTVKMSNAHSNLEELNRQRTAFLAAAAHELKTPLAAIKGYCNLLLAGSLGPLTDKQRDVLEESKDSCERLVRLVSMFLNYSALESGKLVLQLRENDLRDCLDELAKRWGEAFQRKGVKLEVKFDPSIRTFRFDYQKVQNATENLLENALKHTPVDGSVTLCAAPHFWERRVADIAPA